MNIRTKDNNSLLKDLKHFVSEERRILNLVLHHLREVEIRKLHLQMGYPNLYAFCTKELGYSEASAHRRISAMRLAKEIPELEQKIQEGTLNLSVISQAQTHFRRQNSNLEYKKQILKELEHKTIKESEKLLLSLEPLQVIPMERQKALDHEHTEIRFTLSRKALENLEQVRAKLSHHNPSMAEIFEMGLELLLKRHNAPVPPMRSEGDSKSSSSRYIPKGIRNEVSQRDQQKCQYQDPVTKRFCDSRFYLQYDHIKPMALGGRTELKNLRLLCSNHNKFMWERVQSLR